MTVYAAYAAGHVKRDPASGASAIRTIYPESDLPGLAWLVSTVDVGARNSLTEDVAAWEDIYTPPANG